MFWNTSNVRKTDFFFGGGGVVVLIMPFQYYIKIFVTLKMGQLNYFRQGIFFTKITRNSLY